MSQRFLQNIPGFQGVANSGNGVLVLPPALRFHALSVFVTIAGVLSPVATVASNFKLKIGGLTIRDMSPDQAVRLARLYKLTPGVGQIPIFFSEPWLADPRTREMFSWDMTGQAKFTLEMTFLNPGGGAVGIQNVVAEVDTLRNTTPGKGADAGQPVPFLRIVKAKNETFVFGGAARTGNTTLDKSLPIRRLLQDVSAFALTDVEIIADSFSAWNQITTAQLNNIYNNYNIDGTQFAQALVFDFDGLYRSKLTAAALEVKCTATGAATVTTLNMQEAQSFS